MNRRSFLCFAAAAPIGIPAAALATPMIAAGDRVTLTGRPTFTRNVLREIHDKMWPQFATGGSFQIGGPGGVDSNVVPITVTFGERVYKP